MHNCAQSHSPRYNGHSARMKTISSKTSNYSPSRDPQAKTLWPSPTKKTLPGTMGRNYKEMRTRACEHRTNNPRESLAEMKNIPNRQ